MALSGIPGLRVMGQEPDEVEVQIMVTGRRARAVASAMQGHVLYPTEVIPVRIGVPGLDKITGGVLIDSSLEAERIDGDATVTFTILATVEEEK